MAGDLGPTLHRFLRHGCHHALVQVDLAVMACQVPIESTIIHISICIYTCVCIYIYMYRYMHIHVYVDMCIVILLSHLTFTSCSCYNTAVDKLFVNSIYRS